MQNTLKVALGVVAIALSASAVAQITLYEKQGFGGRSFTADHRIRSLDPTGFNDRAASAVVERGHWEVCEHADFGGHCTVLSPGEYPSLGQFGLDRKISSIRPARDERYGYEERYGYDEPPPAVYDYRRHPSERP